MERKKNIVVKNDKKLDEKVLAIILGVFYLVGVIGHSIPLTYKIMLNITPYVLLVSAGVVYFNIETKQKDNFFYWFLGAYVFTFITEIIGVQTGLLFGKYHYTPILGFKLFGVPLIIGINWVIIILGAVLLAKKYVQNIYLIALTAGLITVIFDLVLEPVAVKLFYWSWFDNVIPIKNYITWFIISSLVSFIYLKLKIVVRNYLPIYYLGIQFLFFVLLLIFFV